MKVILASLSETRRNMLESAGVRFEARSALVNEERAKAELKSDGLAAHAIAKGLAEMKALSIEAPKALVLGSDQTLEFGDFGMLDKPASRADARSQLKMLRGKSHFLHSAVVAAENGKIVWRQVDTARLTMRPLSDEFIDDYLDLEFDNIRNSVGGYQIEGRGVQLFEWMEGNYFTILGMPLLPLLDYLRSRGILGS
ncbi:Maf family protein [Sphingosinicella humi]|uniref:Nucleoside triphosphate pyrophosphatase n=1 Tax=Allosphingosinicella humi TaxID=2068657 RepID=A0A2U2J2D0_9SPHN|nr:Maf family protein [Sphingosinicella humi]PWG02505.1 septum formation protein Maf [Sphingosinicella humi]